MLASAFTNAASYTFSRIPESQEWKLKGSVYPEHPRMLNVRYEDFAFLNEIASERYYLFRPNVHEVISTNTVSVFECPPPVNAFQEGKAQDLLAETCGRVIEAFPTNGTMGAFTYGFPPQNAVEVGGASTFGDVSCGQAVTLIGGTDFKAPEIPDSVMSYATNIQSMAMRTNAIIEAYSTATGFDTNSIIVKIGRVPHNNSTFTWEDHISENDVSNVDRVNGKISYSAPVNNSYSDEFREDGISTSTIRGYVNYSCSKSITSYDTEKGRVASAVYTGVSRNSDWYGFDRVFIFSNSVITNNANAPRIKGEIELNLVFSVEYLWIRENERSISDYDTVDPYTETLSLNITTQGVKNAIYLMRPTACSFVAPTNDTSEAEWEIRDVKGGVGDIVSVATSSIVTSLDAFPDVNTPDPSGFHYANMDATETIHDRVSVSVSFLGAFLNYEINPTAKLGGGGQ